MNDKAHYVVGEVGFGPSFGAEAARVELLEAQVAKLIKDRNVLRRVLQDCVYFIQRRELDGGVHLAVPARSIHRRKTCFFGGGTPLETKNINSRGTKKT